MYGTRYIFSRNFFRGWVVVTFLIGWAASLVILIMPLWQGRQALRTFGSFMVTGEKKKIIANAAANSESDEGVEKLAVEDGAEKFK